MEGHYISSRVSLSQNHGSHDSPTTVMSPEDSSHSQTPYRYGMILLCFGALINWIGLAENYTEPIRYAGVACIVGGAILICTAMCCWLQTPNRVSAESDEPIHIIASADPSLVAEKPPEYESVVIAPPNYDDAIKLNPAMLLQREHAIEAAPSYEFATSSSSLDVTSVIPSIQPSTTMEIVNERNNATDGSKNIQASHISS